jgi:exonuclease III
VVREFLVQERVAVIGLQETKVAVMSQNMIYDLTGVEFDYFALPAVEARGGILVAWRRSDWVGTDLSCSEFSVTLKLSSRSAQDQWWWWLTVVYGPSVEAGKQAFLDEIREVHSSVSGPWVICGDFNMNYKAEDTNNSRLNLRVMRRFGRLLDDTALTELPLLAVTTKKRVTQNITCF